MKKKIEYVIVTISLIILLFLTYKIVTNKTIYIDKVVYSFISDNLISSSRTPFIKMITKIASPLGIIVEALLLILFIKNKKSKILIAIDLIGITIINNIFKIIISRPRPEVNMLVNETGFSYPSGHSVTSMVFYGYLIYLIYKYIDNKKIKIPLMLFLILLIFMIGFTRIYLGVHYTSDVLGGYLLGIIYLITFINITEKTY